ncbi:hypothetical protein [Nocardia sp. NPDC056000]|uniref:hypothetical protein n=1 Tax=Nocardia sp. NPDC056000 TaxID=3345674 RepID=UPI0035E03F0C
MSETAAKIARLVSYSNHMAAPGRRLPSLLINRGTESAFSTSDQQQIGVFHYRLRTMGGSSRIRLLPRRCGRHSGTVRSIENSGHDIYKTGYNIRLEFGLEWELRPGISVIHCERQAARSAVAAIAELSHGLFEPLELGIRVLTTNQPYGRWYRSGPEPAASGGHWYLKPAELQAYPTFEGAVIVDTEVVDEAAMLAVVDTAFDLQYELQQGEWASWDIMYVDNTLARLPQSLAPADGEDFIVDDIDNRRRDLSLAVTRRSDGAWVGWDGPGCWPPFSLSAQRSVVEMDHVSYATVLDIDICVHWSVWWEHRSPGRIMLDRAVDRLIRSGWRYSQNPPNGGGYDVWS